MSDPEQTPALKACPFCGGEAAPNTVTFSGCMVREQDLPQATMHSVNCMQCSADIRGAMHGWTTLIDAAHAWNRRAPSEAPEGRTGVHLCPMCSGWKVVDVMQGSGTQMIQGQCPVCIGEGVVWDRTAFSASAPAALHIRAGGRYNWHRHDHR
jgi:hypothetical protein